MAAAEDDGDHRPLRILRAHHEVGLHLRQAQKSQEGLLRRVRRTPPVCTGGRSQEPRLEGAREEGPSLHPPVRGGDEPPRHDPRRLLRLHGLRGRLRRGGRRTAPLEVRLRALPRGGAHLHARRTAGRGRTRPLRHEDEEVPPPLPSSTRSPSASRPADSSSSFRTSSTRTWTRCSSRSTTSTIAGTR